MKQRKLRVEITLHYLKVSAFILILMGFILYISISTIMRSEMITSTKNSVEMSGKYIELYIERLKAVSSIFANNPEVVHYFSNIDRPIESKNYILQMVHHTMQTDPYIESIVLVSKDGEVISNEKGLIMELSSNMMKEEWYLKALQSESLPILTSARMQQFSMDKDNWVISISQKITNANGKNIGVLLIDIQYRVIEDFLKTLDLGNNGFTFLLNNKGEVVYHRDTTYFEQTNKQEELQQILAHKDSYDSHAHTFTHTYELSNADWTFVGVSSLDSLVLLKRQLLQIFLFIGLVLFLLAAGSISIFANRMTKPFSRLEKAMQEIENGLVKVPIDEKGCYEVESLTRHFNEMVIRIEDLMNEVKEKEKRLRTSEINVLQSQINPHFLYNTLDTIIWMAEFNESEKVIDMTKSLAEFFRLSLNSGNEWTTIQKELEHIKHYLYIQQERYGKKLQYEMNDDQTLNSLRIPKLLLQPMVENAIYHGIRPLEETGKIIISVRQESNHIILQVEDNGVGFVIGDRKTSGTKLGGVGIHNVDERVKLYFGNNYGVTMESRIGIGTKVQIILPKLEE